MIRRLSRSLLHLEEDLVKDEVLIIVEVQAELYFMTHLIKGKAVMIVDILGRMR